MSQVPGARKLLGAHAPPGIVPVRSGFESANDEPRPACHATLSRSRPAGLLSPCFLETQHLIQPGRDG